MTRGDNPEVYNRLDWGDESLVGRLKAKTDAILNIIPPDVRTLIDIGCGNGAITHVLAEHYDVTAVDRSETALSFVRTRKIHASSDRIDLPDRSFDMVFSSELLEHLESPVFEGTLTEMKRLSRKYLFITVPNDQSVEKDFIRCPSCGYLFNRAYHIRRFDAAGLAACFPEFHVKKSLTLGLGKRGYVPFLARIKHRITPASSWIAPFWADRGHRQSMCPSCSAEFEYPYRFHPVGFFLDIMNIPLSPKRPYWLMMLFEKE